MVVGMHWSLECETEWLWVCIGHWSVRQSGCGLLECETEWLWVYIHWSVRQSGCGRALVTGV